MPLPRTLQFVCCLLLLSNAVQAQENCLVKCGATLDHCAPKCANDAEFAHCELCVRAVEKCGVVCGFSAYEVCMIECDGTTCEDP